MFSKYVLILFHICAKNTKLIHRFFCLSIFLELLPEMRVDYSFLLDGGVMATNQYHCRVLEYGAGRLEISLIIKLKRLTLGIK